MGLISTCACGCTFVIPHGRVKVWCDGCYETVAPTIYSSRLQPVGQADDRPA